MKTKNKTLAASLAALLAALATVLRFAMRGYDVVALILLVAAILVVLWAFVGWRLKWRRASWVSSRLPWR